MADSFGIKLYVNEAKTGSTYVQELGVLEGSLPEIMKDKYETKTLDQATRAKGYRGSFYDGGSLSFKMQFTKAQYAKLVDWVKDPDSYPIRIVLPDAAVEANCSKCELNVLFEKVGMPLPADGGRLEADVQMQADGDYTFTPGT